MKLVHSIQPRHHLVIWGVSFSLIITSAVVFSSLTAEHTLAEESPNIGGHSFGFGRDTPDAPGLTIPTACKQNPSDVCKATAVYQANDHMRTLLGKMDGHFMATLSEIDDMAARAEALMPQFESAGINKPTRNHMQDDLTTVRSQTAKLRGFFGTARGFMQQFTASGAQDPARAFAVMHGRPLGDGNDAAHSIDVLISTCSDLVTTLDGITK